MLRVTGLLAAVLGALSTPTFGAEVPLKLSAGSRVGVISLMTPDITHFHDGRTLAQGFLRTYRVPWSLDESTVSPIRERLDGLGLAPVPLAPTQELERYRTRLFVGNSALVRLSREGEAELSRIAAEEQLAALVVLVADTNSGSNRIRELPEYVRGWGFITRPSRRETPPTLFNLTQVLLVDAAEGARLHRHEWGGNYSMEWSDFQPPEDLKVMPTAELEKLRPRFELLLQTQLDRIMQFLQAEGAPST